MIDIEKLKETLIAFAKALKAIVKAALNRWRVIKDFLIKENAGFFKNKKQFQHMRSTWNVPFDTRKASQVMMNKPKFTVRKVIQ
ncbi:hypothetical protein [Bacillus smithii]|uniref:hypothetical protein n=1 Tax=Bacillus smithii TaxID=1479 RepID=UPI003D1D6987